MKGKRLAVNEMKKYAIPVLAVSGAVRVVHGLTTDLVDVEAARFGLCPPCVCASKVR